MARPASPHPTEGELELLQILWEIQPAGLGDIRARLQEKRPVATTTVATMLKVMREKGLAKRTQGRRGYLWSSRVSRQAVSNRLLRSLLDRVFDGSAQRLVAHLLESRRLSDADRDAIRQLIDEHDPHPKKR